ADDVKNAVRCDSVALKTALQGEDEAAIKSAFDKLNESQTKLGEAIYQSSTEAAEGPSPTSGTTDGSEEDVVDAEIVDDEDENPSTGAGGRRQGGLPSAAATRPPSGRSARSRAGGRSPRRPASRGRRRPRPSGRPMTTTS